MGVTSGDRDALTLVAFAHMRVVGELYDVNDVDVGQGLASHPLHLSWNCGPASADTGPLAARRPVASNERRI